MSLVAVSPSGRTDPLVCTNVCRFSSPIEFVSPLEQTYGQQSYGTYGQPTDVSYTQPQTTATYGQTAYATSYGQPPAGKSPRARQSPAGRAGLQSAPGNHGRVTGVEEAPSSRACLEPQAVGWAGTGQTDGPAESSRRRFGAGSCCGARRGQKAEQRSAACLFW